jgi:hypothetical protein
MYVHVSVYVCMYIHMYVYVCVYGLNVFSNAEAATYTQLHRAHLKMLYNNTKKYKIE